MHFFGFRVQDSGPHCIFAYDNPLNRSLCLYKKFPAVIVGANPGKFTRPKPKRKPKAAQFTHPGTGKNPRKAKRNREPPEYPGNSLSLPCLFTHVSPTRYFDRRARETGCGFLSPVVRTTPFVPGSNPTTPWRVILRLFGLFPSYRKFGVVFEPPQDSADCMHIRSFSGSFGTTMYATLPEQSNKW